MDWIEVNGTSLRYDLTGSGGTTLVLVHEMGGTLESWDQVLPALSNRARCCATTRAAPGCRRKSAARSRFDNMADDLAALLDALGITGKVALAGMRGRRRDRAAFRRRAPRIASAALVVTGAGDRRGRRIAGRPRWIAPQRSRAHGHARSWSRPASPVLSAGGAARR